jgi:hypothetical protein
MDKRPFLVVVCSSTGKETSGFYEAQDVLPCSRETLMGLFLRELNSAQSFTQFFFKTQHKTCCHVHMIFLRDSSWESRIQPKDSPNIFKTQRKTYCHVHVRSLRDCSWESRIQPKVPLNFSLRPSTRQIDTFTWGPYGTVPERVESSQKFH